MRYSRRQFARLLEQAAILLTASAGERVFAEDLPARGLVLNRALFLPHVGTEFELITPLGPRKLTLFAAEEIRLRRRAVEPAGIERTCLRFFIEGSELPARTWLLRHPVLGEIPLLLSPGLPGRCRADLVSLPAELFASWQIPRPHLLAIS